MKKSGLADSPLFVQPRKTVESTPPPLEPKKVLKDTTVKKKNEPRAENNREKTKTPRHQEIVVSRYHDTIHDTTIEIVRKAVKQFGKEAATHRFTQEEKKEIADIIYTYKNRNTKTSENEITRIAVNYIIEDYKENGENSIIDRVLRALNG